MVLATPVLAVTLGLIALERLAGVGVFDPRLGGDPLLFQHLFWFYSHPAVYIMILPGMGVVSEMITCFSRKRLFGYKFVAYASLAIAIFGFIVWGHHMFVTSQSIYAGMVFSILSFLVSVPSAIKVFNWTATLYKGRITFHTPMLYALGFIGLVHHWRFERVVPRHDGRGHARARDVLRHRAFSLHHGRRHGHGVPRRHPLLVAKDQRPDVQRKARAVLSGGHLHRLQPDVPAAVRAGRVGNASAVSLLPGGMAGVPCALDGGRFRAGGRLRAAALLPDVVFLFRPSGTTEPMERQRPGMERGRIAAHPHEFREDSARGPREAYDYPFPIKNPAKAAHV